MPDTSPALEPRPADYGRPVSIEELSNRFVIHPLSALVARVAISAGISANTISCLGLGCGLIAGVLYYYQDHSAFIWGGFFSMLAWHVFDGADGQVARATNTTSAFGRIIDGICDHLVFGAIYFAFAGYLLKAGYGPTVWLLLIGAALSHAVQAAGYEERRQKYQRRLRGVGREEVATGLLDIDGRPSMLARAYDSAQKFVSGGQSALDEKLRWYASNNAPEALSRSLVKRTAILVRLWALLNANNRTIILAICAFIGQPELYFLYEIIVLNALLVLLLIAERFWEKQIASAARL